MKEDISPGLDKIYPVPNGFMVRSVNGLRIRMVSRLDGRGYDVTKCQSPSHDSPHRLHPLNLRTVGPHTVLRGQTIFIDDKALAVVLSGGRQTQTEPRRTSVHLRIFIDFVDASSYVPSVAGGPVSDAIFTASTGQFAGDPTVPYLPNGTALRFGQGEGVGLVRDQANPTGCLEYTQTFSDEAILVRRGECTFLEKLMRAHEVGASGVVVINDSEMVVNPSATMEDLKDIGDSLDDVAVVVLRESDGRQVSAMLDVAEDRHAGRVVLVLENEECDTASVESEPSEAQSRFSERSMLYINGHPLHNTKLLV